MSATGESATGESATEESATRRWLILTVLGIAQLMVILDSTIVNVALPSAQADLVFSDDARQWVITAYALSFGSLLLLGGRISDIFGRKLTFTAGLVLFALASVLGGFAPSFGTLVAARALQGAGGALLAPAALSLVSLTFTDPDERNRAFGVFGAIAGAGAAIGLLLGGVLTEYLNWRWCLFVNVGFAGVAVAGALVLLQGDRPLRRAPIDLPGTITATTGLFAVVFAFGRAENSGWGSPVIVTLLALGVLLLAAFVLIERRSPNPLLPLHVVADRNRGGSYLAVGLSAAAVFAVSLFLVYFLQQTLAFSPVECGLAFLPLAVSISITAGVAQTRLVDKTGAKPLIVAGLAVGAVAMAMLAQLSVDSRYSSGVLPGLILVGVSFGLVVAPAISGATLGVADEDSGVASAMVNTGQQLGGSIGTALLTTFFASAVTDYAASRAPSAETAAAAAVYGYTVAFWWAAGILAVGTIVIALLMRRQVSSNPKHADQPAIAG